MKRFTTFATALAILAAPGLLQGDAAAEQIAQKTNEAAHADLDELRAYLNKNSAIEFETTFASSDAASDDKVRGKAHFVVRRPNLFRIEAEAGNESYVYVSDGTSMTIYDTRRKLFSQTPAQGTLADNMNLVSGLMGYQAHVFDFLAALDQSANADNDVEATDNGPDVIAGQETERIGVRSPEGQWQVWLAGKGTRLPVRLTTASIDDPTKIAQTNEFEWKTDPVLASDSFVFSPPPGSKKVDLDDLGLAPPE